MWNDEWRMRNENGYNIAHIYVPSDEWRWTYVVCPSWHHHLTKIILRVRNKGGFAKKKFKNKVVMWLFN